MRPPREDTKPWYRQFWPWFLIALPGTVVMASMVTIWLAASTSDSLVRDDYYKQGLAINRDRAREHIAASLGVQLVFTYDAATGLVTAHMNDAPVGSITHLNLSLVHPTLAGKDATTRLLPAAERQFRGRIALETGGLDWHVVVTPPGDTWKLRGRWNPLTKPRLTLPAESAPDQAG